VAVDGPDDLEAAFSRTAEQRADALLLFQSPMFYAQRRRIVDLATMHRLPLMAMDREFADLGGLISYGASIFDLVRRSAIYVDKIIKGAKPAELPVEQPTTFELVINLTAARTLGVTISPTLLAIADEVIE
jgi:putative ABC transport system substrate-binding protein